MQEGVFSAPSAVRDIADELESRPTYQLLITSKEARTLAAAFADAIYKDSVAMSTEEEGLYGALCQIGNIDPEPETA